MLQIRKFVSNVNSLNLVNSLTQKVLKGFRWNINYAFFNKMLQAVDIKSLLAILLSTFQSFWSSPKKMP